jgi:hypothetical protein
MKECSENVLLQSAKRLWRRASLNESDHQDYLNTLSTQPDCGALSQNLFFSDRTLLDSSPCPPGMESQAQRPSEESANHSIRVVRVDRVSLCGRRY